MIWIDVRHEHEEKRIKKPSSRSETLNGDHVDDEDHDGVQYDIEAVGTLRIFVRQEEELALEMTSPQTG